MAIYVDANILWRWRTSCEADCLAISIVDRQTEQQILVAQLAAEEAEAHVRRFGAATRSTRPFRASIQSERRTASG
jgi:hypothetical protein